jgi:hypothetical protein
LSKLILLFVLLVFFVFKVFLKKLFIQEHNLFFFLLLNVYLCLCLKLECIYELERLLKPSSFTV